MIFSCLTLKSSYRALSVRALLQTAVVIPATLFLTLANSNAERAAHVDPGTLVQSLDKSGKLVTCAAHPRTGKGVLVEPRGSGYVATKSAARAGCSSFNQLRRNRGGSKAVSEKSLRLGVMAPSAVVSLAAAQLDRFTFALLEATNLAGQARATGTLTQVSQSPLQYQYSPQPTDRLRGVQLDGTVYEFVLQDIQGDFSFGVTNFFQADHRLVFQAAEVGSSNITVSDIQVDGVRTIRVTGSGMFDGTPLTVDVTGQGRDVSEITYRTTLTGTITGDGIAINLSEGTDTAAWDMGYGYATKIQKVYSRRINTSWTVGGTKFSLRNGSIAGKFKSGAPIEYLDPSRWFAKGILSVNGKKAGQLRLVRKSSGIGVVLSAGKVSLVLQSWGL
jgi:hypothetical protein